MIQTVIRVYGAWHQSVSMFNCAAEVTYIRAACTVNSWLCDQLADQITYHYTCTRLRRETQAIRERDYMLHCHFWNHEFLILTVVTEDAASCNFFNVCGKEKEDRQSTALPRGAKQSEFHKQLQVLVVEIFRLLQASLFVSVLVRLWNYFKDKDAFLRVSNSPFIPLFCRHVMLFLSEVSLTTTNTQTHHKTDWLAPYLTSSLVCCEMSDQLLRLHICNPVILCI